MAGSGKIRVLTVDDIVESRDNVAKLLRFEPDVEIVGTAEGGQEGIDLAFQLEPDIVLMDINMPGIDGITATTRVSSRLPNTAVIMMSVQNEPDYLRRSMLAGAREFLSKPFSLDELVESIRHVHQLAQSSRRVVAVDAAAHATSPSGGKAKRAQVISLFGLKGGVGRSTNTHSSGVKVLLAPPDPQAGDRVTAEHMRQILHHLHAMVDYIIVDTRPSFDDVTMSLLDHSHRILVVMTLELMAIKGAKQYLELSDLLGYDSDKIQLVLNWASVQSGIPVADVQGSLKGDIVAKLPDDPMAVLRAINEGVPFQQSAPNSALAQEIAALADFLLRPEGVAETDEPTPIATPQSKGLGRWIRPGQKRKAG